MNKTPLVGGSICAVVLLVLGSLSNVAGYQTVQTIQQNVIKERINQRELLFQTICDIVNDKDIQRIILKSEMNRGIFPTSEIPILTMNQLMQMYNIGLKQSKIINKSLIDLMGHKYQLLNSVTLEEITTIIENNPVLKGEVAQLQDFLGNCGNNNSTDYPILCGVLTIFFIAEAAILLPFKLIYDLFMGIFNGTLLESFIVFFGLILDIILFPVILLLGVTLYLIFFEFSCWDIVPYYSII